MNDIWTFEGKLCRSSAGEDGTEDRQCIDLTTKLRGNAVGRPASQTPQERLRQQQKQQQSKPQQQCPLGPMGCSGLRALQIGEMCLNRVVKEGACKNAESVMTSDACKCLEECQEDRKFLQKLADRTRLAERCAAVSE